MANEGKKSEQITYTVLRDCFGFPPVGGDTKATRAQAQRQDVPDVYYTKLWKKGDRVTLDSDIKVPKHFHDVRQEMPANVRSKRRAISAKKVKRLISEDAL
jgi:hypothetical protein